MMRPAKPMLNLGPSYDSGAALLHDSKHLGKHSAQNSGCSSSQSRIPEFRNARGVKTPP